MKSMRNRAMGILIQEKDTKQSYKHHRQWTDSRAEARCFATAPKIIQERKFKADNLLAFEDVT